MTFEIHSGLVEFGCGDQASLSHVKQIEFVADDGETHVWDNHAISITTAVIPAYMQVAARYGQNWSKIKSVKF